MTTDLIKRLRKEIIDEIGCCDDQVCGNARRADCVYEVTAQRIVARIMPIIAATALEQGVWKPDLETVARIIDPVAFDQIGRVDRRRAALAKARDILALPSQASI